MLDELTPTQFDEWLAYAQLEPFGSLKEAERESTLFACVHNLAADSQIEHPEVLEAWGYDLGGDDGSDVLNEDQTFALICGAFGVA